MAAVIPDPRAVRVRLIASGAMTPHGLAAKVAAYVDMLARGGTLHPAAKNATAKKPTPARRPTQRAGT